LDVWVALLLIGLAVVAGGLLLRRVSGGLLAFLGVLVVFGFGIPAIVIDDNQKPDSSGGETSAAADTGAEAEGANSGRDEAAGEEAAGGGSDQASGGSATASAEGKQIFTQSCGTCHTLADAGTNGNVGPVLDELKPDKARVENAIKTGGAGSGAMPANIVTGKEATAVAEYVSSVAGG
jgi:mono/diheme cytochrome c family protein